MPKKIKSKKTGKEVFEEKESGNEQVRCVRLKVCEVCGEQRTDVVTCRMCGIHFCSECGYPENHLCFSCGDETEEALEDEAEETLIESSEPKPEE